LGRRARKLHLRKSHELPKAGSQTPLLDGEDLPSLWKAVAHAESLDRVDLLKPLQPRIREIFGEFSRVNRRLNNRKAA
jgi:hypothetical protein